MRAAAQPRPGYEWSPRPDHEREARRLRYRAREVLWSLSSLERVRKCGRVARAEVVPVVVGDGVAHFANVTRCASVHACPVCSARIRQRRAGEIATALASHFAAGGTATFVTGTMPHDQGDRLAGLYGALTGGTRAMWGGGAWMADRAEFGVVGVIRAVEVTVGGSGWHPHVHALIFHDRVLSSWERTALARRLGGRWRAAVEKAGYRRPDGPHGFQAVPVSDAAGVAAYTAKLDGDVTRVGVSLELARHDLKAARRAQSRSAWELLDDLQRWGDTEDLVLWQEYEQATKGKRAIVWSKGLRDRLGVDVVSDEAVVEEEVPGVVVFVLDRDAWRLATRVRGGAALLLDLAELGGTDAVALGLRELSRGHPPGG